MRARKFVILSSLSPPQKLAVAVCCSVLQCVAVCCSALQMCCSVLQCIAVCCSVLQCAAVCCNIELSLSFSKVGYMGLF